MAEVSISPSVIDACHFPFNGTIHDCLVDRFGLDGVYLRIARKQATMFQVVLESTPQTIPIVYDSTIDPSRAELRSAEKGILLAVVEAMSVPIAGFIGEPHA